MKKFLLCLLSVLLFMPMAMKSQTTDITVGTGTTAGYYVPFGNYYHYSWTESIYPSDEIGSAGTITGIAYQCAASYSLSFNTLKIYMGTTSSDAHSSASDWLPTSDLTLVYQGSSISMGNATGWQSFQLDDPFSYDGQDNLVIVVAKEQSSYSSSQTWNYTSSTNASIYRQDDSETSYAQHPGTTAGTMVSYYPNVKLTMFPTPVTCPKPTNFAVENVASNEVTLSWSPRGSESSWDLYITDQSNMPDEYTTPTTSVTDTFHTEYNLTPSTHYHAYVRANCGSEFSGWKRIDFATTCVPLTTLPYMMDFDSENGISSTTVTATENNLPLCWDHLCGTYSSYAGYPFIYSSSTYAASGTNAMRFYTSTSTTDYGNQYAILPAIDLSYYQMNNLQISMDVRKNSTSYTSFTLYVGVMTDASNPASFVPVDTLILPNTTYENHIVYFTNYEGLGNRIALMAPKVSQSGVSYNTGYVDNIIVETIPTCIKPTNVTLSNVTTNSVDVNWIPGAEETAWEVAVVEHGDDIANAIVENAYSHPYTVSNLTDSTQYDVYVRADCGGGDYSSWTFAQTFTTNPLCSSPGAVTVSQITGTSAMVSWESAPYGPTGYTVEYSEAGQNNWMTADVDGNSYMMAYLNPQTQYEVRITTICDAGSAPSVTKTFTTNCLAGGEVSFDAGTSTNYYIPVNNFYNYTYSQQIFLASEMNGATDITGVAFQYAYSSPSTAKTNVNIYMGHTSQSSFTSTSNYIPSSNLQLVYSGNLNCTQGWNTFNFTTPFHYNGSDNIVIAVDDNSGDYDGNSYTFYVHSTNGAYRSLYYYSDSYNPDPSNPSSSSASSSYDSGNRSNIKFLSVCDSLTTCIAPNAYIAEKTSETITVDWAPGYNESSWNLEYSTDGTNWISEGSVTAPYTLTGLTSDTPYSIRIQSDCGGGDVSDWKILNTRTECSSVTIPYFENFDDAPASGSGNMVSCWTRNTNYTSTAYPYTSNGQHHSGNYSVYFYGTSSYYSYLASPRFDDQVSMNDLQIQFWAYKTTASYNIEVGIMSDPEDYNTFVSVGQVSPSAVSTWEMFEVRTDNYTGDGHYVAFRIPAAITSYMYIDDINVDAIPLCLHVNNVHVNDATVTATTVDVAWTPGDQESEWVYVYGLAGTITNPELEAQNTVYSTPSVTLTGLTGNTAYDIFVKANCDNGESSTWMMASFRTACVPIDQLPYIENLESYEGTTLTTTLTENNLPACWSYINTATSSSGYWKYPAIYNSSTYAASGTNSIRFYSGTYSYYGDQYAVMPQLDVNQNPMNTVRVKFDLRAYSTSYTTTLKVGVMTDPENPSTFQSVQTFTTTSTSYDTKIVDFTNYTGTGEYVAFLIEQPVSSPLYNACHIDNITLEHAPDCAHPTGLTASAVSQYDVTLDWTAGDQETEWEVVVVNGGQALSTGTPITVYTNSALVDNLNPATNYDAYVRSVCPNGGYSDYVILNFNTLCEDIQLLPVSYNFDDVAGATTTSVADNNLPLCWNYYNVGTSTSYSGYPIIYNSSSYAASGSNAMRFYTCTTSGTYADQVAILPPIDVNTYDISTLQLTFDARAISASYTFTLVAGVMTSPSDITTFVPTDTLIINSTNYDTYNMYFPNYTGAGQLIALMAPQFSGPAYNEGYVDNIILDVAPACSPVNHLQVSNVAGSSALISWEDGVLGVTSDYVLEYSEHGLDSWTTITGIVNTSYTLSGLNPQTHYDVRVMANCGSDASTWQTVDFTTHCLAGGDIEIGDGSSTTYSIPVNTYYNHSYVQELYLASEIGATGDINSISFHYIYSTAQTKSPVTIYLGTTSQNTLSSWVPVSNMQQVFSGSVSLSNSGDGWVTIPFTTPFNYDGMQNLVVAVLNNTGSYTTSSNNTFSCHSAPGMCIRYQVDGATPIDPSSNPSITTESNRSDVKFGFPCDNTVTCIAPNIFINNVGQTTADLTWVPGNNESSWNMAYMAEGDDDWTLVPGLTGNEYNFTGLNTNTVYYVRMQSDCGGGDTSTWVGATFRTDCSAISIPFTENFDTYGTGESAYPMCWGKINTYSSNRPYINTTNFSAPGCLYFYTGAGAYNIAVAPEIDPNVALSTLQVSFKYRVFSTSDRLIVGMMTDPDDANTFVGIDTLSLPAASTWYDATVYLASYQGTGRYVALKNMCLGTATTAYAYVDDFVIEEAPTCLPPQNLTATNVTTNSVDLTWTEIGNATTWIVEYGPTGFTVGTGTTETVYSTSTTISGLTASTAYDFYVKSDCGGGDESANSNVLTIMTACDAITTLPFEDSFDTYGTGSTIYPACWSKINTYSSDRPYINTTNYSAPGAMYFYAGTSGTYNIAITPLFDASIPVNTLQATFMYKGSGSNDRLIIGVISNPMDASTFVPVDTVYHTSAWTEYEVPFNNYTGTGQYIAFKNEYTTTYGYAYLDNLQIDVIPSCPKPQDLVVTDQTSSSITLSWTEVGSATQWNIEYGPTGFTQGAGTTEIATSNPYTITSLTTDVYDFYVQADCGGGDVSPWRGPITAQPGAINMPVTGTVNVTTCDATIYDDGGINGVYSNNCESYMIINPETPGAVVSVSGTIVAESSTYDYLQFLDGAGTTGAQLYKTNQTGSSQTLNFGPITSTTGPLTIHFHSDASNTYSGFAIQVSCITCPPVSNVTATSSTTSSVTLSWTETGAASAWNIEYGPAGFTQGTGTTVSATSNPFTVTGLNASTNYDFYVQADCGGGDVSPWTLCSAATDCDAVTLPYTENFDSYTGTTYSTTGPTPTCWTTWTDNTSYPAPHVTSSGTGCYPSSGTNALTFVASSSADGVSTGASAIAVLPTFVEDLNTLKLTFAYRMESATYGELRVGYVTNPNSPLTTFTQVAVIPGTTTVSTDSIDFSTATNVPATGNIAFYWYKESTWYTCSVDDIVVTQAGTPGPGTTCDAPTNVHTTNVGQTSATIAWTAGGDETSWNLQYKATSSSSWSSNITVNNNASYTLTGLTANTAYQVRVQAVCDANSVSTWTNGTFTTLNQDEPSCPAPTNVAANDITSNSAVITWNQEPNTASSWTVLYKQTAASAWETATANAMTYTLSGLNAETQYDVQVMANCDNGMQSAASETIHFTTIAVGINNYVLDAAFSVYPNPTNGQFTIYNEQYTINSVSVYDVYGKLISTTKVEDTHVTLDINTYADGVYFARILTDKGVVTKRIVKK